MKRKDIRKTQSTTRKLLPLIYVCVIALPLFLTLRSIIFGYFPFWYDPARDLLLAAANIKKLSLIGQPSGIPGIFYGPYWIWFLSLGELVNKDPRVVMCIVETIPYYLILPTLLYIVGKKMFTLSGAIIVWILFIFSFISYTDQLWNPNLAPLFFFALVAVIMSMNFGKLGKPLIAYSLLLGVLEGLLMNFHISFAVGVLVSIVLYFVFRLIRGIIGSGNRVRNGLTVLVSAFFTGLGFVFMMVPFLLFELRHGFNQVSALMHTLTQSYIHGAAVVGQTGFTKMQIITSLLDRPALILQLPLSWSVIVSALLGIFLSVIMIKKRKTVNAYQQRFFVFFCTTIAGVFLVYLSTKNPVWQYHFIATEVLFVYAIWMIFDHVPQLKKLAVLWIIFLVINGYVSAFKPADKSADISDLSKTEYNVRTVFNNAQQKPFSYVAKNPAIYTYDYDYLFYWLGSDVYHFIPENTVTDSSKIVYVIIPKAQLSDKKGFVENRTPEKEYVTVNEWYGIDGTLIIRRQLKDIQTK